MYQDWKVVKFKKSKPPCTFLLLIDVAMGKGDKVLAYAAKTGEAVETVQKGTSSR